MSRVVSWFSCGAASAVATKLAIEKYGSGVIVASCVVNNEHPDNERFLKDCEKWYGTNILRLKSEKYADCWDVWEKTKFLVGIRGARCTTEMKKIGRAEQSRAERFMIQNPEVDLVTSLIENNYTKKDCFDTLQKAGIELPTMYKLGYKNNNCIGCVKGGAGYWNKIRSDFPEVFKRMSELERKLGRTILKIKGKRIYLDELDLKAGHKQKEPDMQCGLWCGK